MATMLALFKHGGLCHAVRYFKAGPRSPTQEPALIAGLDEIGRLYTFDIDR